MTPDNRSTALRGGMFLWGGLALGIALVAALLTRGFGLMAVERGAGSDVAKFLARAKRARRATLNHLHSGWSVRAARRANRAPSPRGGERRA
jgi:hypothetical protein